MHVIAAYTQVHNTAEKGSAVSEETPKTKKKVVRASTKAPASGSKAPRSKAVKTNAEPAITWQATPEAKSKARTFRIIAMVAWLVAIALEFYVIYKELDKEIVNTWLVVGLIVVIGALAITGSILWKKANKLDPASEKNKFKFFVQNQLGAIMAALAFIPLIVLVFTNKNMDGKQKGIVGAVALLMFGGAFATGVTTDAPSIEKYSQDKNLVMTLMGSDEVYWTAGGGVYHLCANVSDLQRENDNDIIVGTIAEAQAEGKERLTKKVETEAKQCGVDEAVYGPAISAWNEGTLENPDAPVVNEGSTEEPTEEETTEG